MNGIKKVEAFSFDNTLYATEHEAVSSAVRKATAVIIDSGGGTANLPANLIAQAHILAPLLTRLVELEDTRGKKAIVDPSLADNHTPGCGVHVGRACDCPYAEIDNNYSGPSINGSPRLEM